MEQQHIETIAYVISCFVIAYWITKNWRVFLRDYFAAKAFQTRLAKYNDWTLDELTDQAYRDADALLKAREK